MVRGQIVKAQRQLAEVQARINEEKLTIHAAAEHFDASRERLVREFTAFHELLAHIQPDRDGVKPPAPEPAPRVAAGHQLCVAPVGPPIGDINQFVKERLAPILASWTSLATLLQAKLLHAAILSCRWILVPSPAWGIAYAEAIGPASRLCIVAVEPTWLTFADACKSEAAAYWCEAIETSEIMHLLMFVDVDRALPQCWARPWLDLIAGFRANLPPPAGFPWPNNLRVLACPAADDAVSPVPDYVLAHWAGVVAAKDAAGSSKTPVMGHVPYAVWESWIPAGNDGPPVIAPEAARLGGAVRAATTDLHRLRAALEPMVDDDSERARDFAHRVRLDYPREMFVKGTSR